MPCTDSSPLTLPPRCSGATAANARQRPTRYAPPPKSSAGANAGVSTWNTNNWQGQGLSGRAQACGTVLPFGGYAINGAFGGKRNLVVWVKKNNGRAPDVTVKASGRVRRAPASTLLLGYARALREALPCPQGSRVVRGCSHGL